MLSNMGHPFLKQLQNSILQHSGCPTNKAMHVTCKQDCLPAQLDLPPEHSQLQQLTAVIKAASLTMPLSSRSGLNNNSNGNNNSIGSTAGSSGSSTPEASASSDNQLLNFQLQTCTALMQLAQKLATDAASTAAAAQYTAGASTGIVAAPGAARAGGDAATGGFATAVPRIVMEACCSWVNELAVRLCHYTCRYLLRVLV